MIWNQRGHIQDVSDSQMTQDLLISSMKLVPKVQPSL